MDLKIVPIEKPEDMNFVMGHSHFIKTVDDLYETVVQHVPGIKFGISFCEASGKCLVRHAGNDDKLIDVAIKNAQNIAAGHTFFIFMEDAFPINILNSVKTVPEVCRVYCATANPTQVLVAETEQGRAIVGVVDGFEPKGVEQAEDIDWRKDLLRKLGYKQ